MGAKPPLIEAWDPPDDIPRVFEALRNEKGALLLDSGLPMKSSGRHSFFSALPFLTLRSRGREVILEGDDGRIERLDDDPFSVLQRLLETYRLPHDPDGPPFQGGAAGYFAYDLGRFVERLPTRAEDDLGLPELWLGFYDTAFAFDAETGRGWIVSTGLPARGDAGRRRAGERIETFRDLLERGREGGNTGPRDTYRVRGELRSNFTRESYVRAVDRCRRYIIEGDIFQVNLSQRFGIGLEGSPFALYRRLREINPAPFASYLHTDAVDVVSASPERFLRVEGDRVQSRPIKGTRPRGATREEDRRLAEELFGAPKDRAENTMIVDLLRNDLGRVCRPGSVRVRELCALETFPTVFHLTSTVEGRLEGGRDRIDLLRASFPGGSITGAPKIRAMEIIEALEPTRRSVYTGALGYLSFSGSMDLNIVIRTILCTGGRALFQAGGGIVYDSDPELEYEETLHKGKALAEALQGRTR
jgi:para-aminobenzoate synthetase component 1